MLLQVSALQGHLQDSNSLCSYHIVLRFVVDVPSCLFDLSELRVFLCHIRCVVVRCAYQELQGNAAILQYQKDIKEHQRHILTILYY